MTDGLENASHNGVGRIKSLVEQQTKESGWQFLYMGADQDAVEVGSSVALYSGQNFDNLQARQGSGVHSVDVARHWWNPRAHVAACATAEQAAKLIAFDDEQRAASRE